MGIAGSLRKRRQGGDLRPEVAHILELVGLSQHVGDICRITERLALGDKSVIEDLTGIPHIGSLQAQWAARIR